MANDPKEALDLPWWPKPAARTVQREPLSRDQIVAAAVRFIDAEGLEALSMRRLGQALDAGATSLYTHVRSKDELLALVNDLIAGEILGETKLEQDAPWREQAAECARAVRRVLVERHPHAAALFARSGAGPNALGVVEALLSVLRPAGFEGKTLLLAYGAVLNHGYSYAASEAAYVVASPNAGREQVRAMAEALVTSLPADRFPNLVAAAPAMATLTPDEQFEFGLQRLLDGLEALLARQPFRESA